MLLPTLGSAGDVHPFIALGKSLQARGSRATLLTNPLFQPLIEAQGLGFLPVGTTDAALALIAEPALWHAHRGFKVVAQQLIVPAIAEIYRLIATHADADTVVACSSLSLGARIAQEKLGVPTATVHLQPTVIRSLIDQGLMGGIRIADWQPAWFKQGFFKFIDWALIDRLIGGPLNDFRATLGMGRVDRVMHRWMHSPQLVIGFFPGWFATPQADWPTRMHLVGFPMWDGGGGEIPVPPEAQEFLDAGEPPLIFTPGSAGSTMHRFFAESIEAARRLRMRALLVTNFPEQIVARLPASIRTFGYLPFSRVLPRAALLVHHGGIGTLAQAVKAGIPQLIVPNGHDQFDNGWRILRLGLGRSIPQTRYRAGPALRTIRAMQGDTAVLARVQSYATRIDGAAALTRACELIEELAAQALPARPAVTPDR